MTDDLSELEADEPLPAAARGPYPLVARSARPELTCVQARNLRIGNGHVGFIAGPCSVESRTQILDLAQRVRDAGAQGLRGGAYKPRTSPYSFQGLREKGLEYLAEARERTGLAIVTEVMSPELVPVVARYADVLQIGARNMQNYPLLEAVGATRTAVLLKRGPSATLEEWLFAAEYILKGGNDRVILCERGIRTFETHTRFTLPLATVPFLRQKTHLPIIVDPSHGTGVASLVEPMSRAALAVGADGLIIEVHDQPETALSDGDQALTSAEFASLMRSARRLADVL